MSTASAYLTVAGIDVDIVYKEIKNLHIGVYPPMGRVRVAAPKLLDDDQVRLAVGLLALGTGWSCTMVAGSALLSESVSAELRTSAQGLSDVTMGLAGASAGALSGAIVQGWGFPTLTLIAALATVPFIVLATRQGRR